MSGDIVVQALQEQAKVRKQYEQQQLLKVEEANRTTTNNMSMGINPTDLSKVKAMMNTMPMSKPNGDLLSSFGITTADPKEMLKSASMPDTFAVAAHPAGVGAINPATTAIVGNGSTDISLLFNDSALSQSQDNIHDTPEEMSTDSEQDNNQDDGEYVDDAVNNSNSSGSQSKSNSNSNGGNLLRLEPRASAAGPLRNRRGHQGRQLSINSDVPSSAMSNHHGVGGSESKNVGINDENVASVPMTRAPGSLDSIGSSDIPSTSTSGQRTVKMGELAFTIPLGSPKIPPQLQANVRMTSTGKPSHARKVPEDHVKRPRNAFILFRSYACTNNLLPPSMGITDHRQVSRIVGQLWKGLKPDEKAIWEKLAFEEKEAHKLQNPNYRYRPTYRKEVPSKRRRKKAVDEDEVEEEDRKCEVVARVLLEGREVSTEQLEKEVEDQRTRDQLEGRQRNSRSRSRSRSVNSKTADLGTLGAVAGGGLSVEPFSMLGPNGRPNSAPPQGIEMSNDDTYPAWDAATGGAGLTNRPKRSRTIANPGPQYKASDYVPYGMPSSLLGDPSAVRPFDPNQRFSSDLSGHLAAPSPRTAANLQQLFQSNNMSTSAHSDLMQTNSQLFGVPVPHNNIPPSPMLGGYGGFKASNADPSLLSPSFTRKFSLGRWEVPQHAATQSSLASYGNGMAGVGGASTYMTHQFPPLPTGVPQATTGQQHNGQATDNSLTSAGSTLSSQDQQPHYTTDSQTQAASGLDPAAAPPGYNYVPTYVYLSKEDAQNPQIVEHYLSQGFGVSYDA